MANQRVQDAYKQLIKYFQSIEDDSFLTAAIPDSIASIVGLVKKPSGVDNADIIKNLYNFLYADSIHQESFSDIVASMKSYGDLKGLRDYFCVTPWDASYDGESEIPLNRVEDKDQGYQGSGFHKAKGPTYKLEDIVGLQSNNKNVSAIQVFQADMPYHGADSNISALFLSSIDSVIMSQAVPYIDVLISTAVDDKNENELLKSSFSLGRFLGGKGSDRDLGGSFLSSPGKSVASSVVSAQKDKKIGAVAAMEIFTTPQTMVNGENVSYNEDNPGRIDAFRPFLAMNTINIQVLPTGFGAISKKTADIQLTLFDKGRLSEIAPLVSPLAYNTVQFDITYGWSHPAGSAGKKSSSDITNVLGEFIDAMKVTDVFTVANSNFTFNQDGSVTISLKLVSTGMTKFSSKELILSSGFAKTSALAAQDIEALLRTLKDKISQIKVPSKNLFIPVAIADGNFDGFVSMEQSDIESLRKTIEILGSGGKTIEGAAGVKDILKKLVGVRDPKNKKAQPKSMFNDYQNSRAQEAEKFVEYLAHTPDPFIARGVKSGVTDNDFMYDIPTKYASLGKILIAALTSYFSETGEVMYIFGAFNENAAAVRDHNVAQFPILLSSDNEKNISLKSVLTNYYKKNKSITPEAFINLLTENFIEVQMNKAYGLNTSSQQSKEEKKEKKDQKNKNKDEGSLLSELQKIDNLKHVYEAMGQKNLSDPTFVVPKITMSVDCRKTLDSKNVIKVIIQDSAHDHFRTTGQLFTDILSQGFVLSPNSSFTNSREGARTPKHGKNTDNIIKMLSTRSPPVLVPLTTDGINPIKDDRDAIDKVIKDFEGSLILEKNTIQKIREMKKIFYDYFPTIIIGSMGSGVINAQLSSQQNDALKTIAVSQAVNQKVAGEEPNLDYGMILYPTQLTIEAVGSPIFKFMQRFFIDFGTNTSADNFYVITGINMNFAPGVFKSNLTMRVNDIFARTINIRKTAAMGLLEVSRKTQK